MPKCEVVHIDHADRSDGLITKLEDAYRVVDKKIGGGPVLFHCGAGASRSTSALIGYALTRGLDNISDAFENMIAKRPLAMNMWHGFVEELQMLSDGLSK
jgi:protein-tyrosine phosphatase